MTPSLTTIHQPKHPLGQKAVDMLKEKINTKSESNQIIELERQYLMILPMIN